MSKLSVLPAAVGVIAEGKFTCESCAFNSTVQTTSPIEPDVAILHSFVPNSDLAPVNLNTSLHGTSRVVRLGAFRRRALEARAFLLPTLVTFEFQTIFADVLDIVDHFLAVFAGNVGFWRVHSTSSMSTLTLRCRQKLLPGEIVRAQAAGLVPADLSDFDDFLGLFVWSELLQSSFSLLWDLDSSPVAAWRCR